MGYEQVKKHIKLKFSLDTQIICSEYRTLSEQLTHLWHMRVKSSIPYIMVSSKVVKLYVCSLLKHINVKYMLKPAPGFLPSIKLNKSKLKAEE